MFNSEVYFALGMREATIFSKLVSPLLPDGDGRGFIVIPICFAISLVSIEQLLLVVWILLANRLKILIVGLHNIVHILYYWG